MQHGRENKRILPFLKGILWNSRHPPDHLPRENTPNTRPPNASMARRHNNRNTRNKEQHTQKLESVLTKLENKDYRASKKKSKFYQKETVWVGHTFSQDGIRPK